MPPTAQPKYIFRIKSLHEDQPHLPEHPEGFHLHRSIEEGSPISLDDLYHARIIFSAFESSPLVKSARFRVQSIEAAHATASLLHAIAQLKSRNDELEASNIELEILTDDLEARSDELQARIENQEDMCRILTAITANERILARNRKSSRPDMQMLQKTVPNHGLRLALAAAHTIEARDALVAPTPVAELGTTPPAFDRASASHEDVLQLIMFYGEDFSIVPEDELGQRLDKIEAHMGCVLPRDLCDVAKDDFIVV